MKGDCHFGGEDKKYVYCAIMGDEMVGKTSISKNYDRYEATVFENYVVPVEVAGDEIFISMFDVSAKKNFESLRSFAYQESQVLVLCFSTADRETFTNIKNHWMPELKRHSKTSKQKRPVILVGTQIDLRVGYEDSEVSADEGVQLAKDIGADCYVECSAWDQQGLKEVFDHVVQLALRIRKKKTNIFKKVFRRKSGSFVK